MEYKGLTLDPFQEDAIKSIEKNNSVVVSAPTGSGKTLIADYIINKDIARGIRVIYTAPIKALSNQKYKDFCKDYGTENVGLLTGDITKNPGAPIMIMTTEIYRNMAIIQDPALDSVSYVIFDEIHFINDIERGYVWEESIIFSKPNVRFLCLSATIPNAKEFADWIKAIKKHEVDVIKHETRLVKLHKFFYDTELGITDLDRLRQWAEIPEYAARGRKYRKQRINPPSHIDLVKDMKENLPCFFFNFSRMACQENAAELAQAKLFEENPKISQLVREKLAASSPEINQFKSSKILRQILPFGIAFHHAGMLPVMKELVEELFGKGLIKVLYTTETFAVGINMPAKSVCFEALRKFDGITFRPLHSKEYFQIAGRAGRRGIDTEGFVYVMVDRRDFDYKSLKKITTADTEPIRSQFKLGINTVLNIIKRHQQKEIDKILCQNFYSFQKYGYDLYNVKRNSMINTFNNQKKKLEKLDYLKESQLTEKGNFASKIYSDEILTTEIFGTEFYHNLNEFQVLMLIACICYEPRQKTEFYKTYRSKFLEELKRKIGQNMLINKDKRFKHIEDLTALVHPCYYGESIFQIVRNVNLLEGDVIRFFRQLLDRIGQVKAASMDYDLCQKMENCKRLVEASLKEVDVV
jgi:superfamily II RNA helicase